MIKFIMIYLIGFFTCYICMKLLRNYEGKNDWKHVYLTIKASLLSWIGIVIMVIALICCFTQEYLECKYTKPPKWL